VHRAPRWIGLWVSGQGEPSDLKIRNAHTAGSLKIGASTQQSYGGIVVECDAPLGVAGVTEAGRHCTSGGNCVRCGEGLLGLVCVGLARATIEKWIQVPSGAWCAAPTCATVSRDRGAIRARFTEPQSPLAPAAGAPWCGSIRAMAAVGREVRRPSAQRQAREWFVHPGSPATTRQSCRPVPQSRCTREACPPGAPDTLGESGPSASSLLARPAATSR